MSASSKPQFSLPGSLWLFWMGGLATLAVPCHGLTLYEFGNPKAEEQLFIELINRARANPHAEGVRLATTTDPAVLSAYNYAPYWTVNLDVMKAEFDLIAAQPPLAPNSCLTTSARSHSVWMLATATQAHNETNPANTPFTRMTAAGYVYTSAGENIYASANSVWFGHAGFEVDWGPGTDGMQAGRGHRVNIHNAIYREIGVGVSLGSNGVYPNSVGPLLVTQDFGASNANPALATGVAYYDLNANNFYDIGEGISGLTVNVSGTGVTQYCTTAIGGGWVVPIPTTATTRTVTFSGLNMNQNVNLVVAAAKNAKADLQLTYVPPTITSSASVAADISHTVAFTAIGGATSYKWNRWNLTDAAAENCDSTANITSSTTGSYAVLNTTIKQQGTASLHLENPTGANQSIQLNSLYYGQSAPSLVFQSRIAAATTSEFFKVQIKEEGASTWQDVSSQAGTNSTGAAVFTQNSTALGAMTGKAFRIRFLLNSTGSYYQTGSGNTFGWFIDAITFTGVSTLGNNVMQTLTSTNGSFTPNAGTYLMSVTPVISERDYPAAYQTLTANSKTPAMVTLGSLAATYNGSPKPATASTTPNGLPVTVTYDGSATAPINAGSYAVVGTIIDANYQGDASGTLVIAKVPATVTLNSLTANYNGSQISATATTTPNGLNVTYTYNGSATAPTNAGSYAVVGTINDPNYQGSATGTLVISKTPATVTLNSLAATYNGSPKSATATTTPGGLTVAYTYNGSATAPTNAGSYAVIGTINDPNYQGNATGTLVISKSPATVTLGSLAANYNGRQISATATTTPGGLTVAFTYNGSATAPTNAGSYAVVGTISDSNYQGGATGTLVISKAPATVTLGSLAATYNGSPKSATATTTPDGLTVAFTYNGSATAPTNTGSYAVVGTIIDPNYQGSATGTLVIAKIPVILSQPVSPTITKNTSTTLTIVASGTSLTFQWYSGSAGDTSTPINGATGASYTTPTLTKGTYYYWVCVSNAGGPVNSITSTVTASSGTITRSFATWASEIENANSLASNTIADAEADYDHDGRSNLLEYAFGASPIIGNDAAPRMPVAQSSPTHFILQYQRDTSLTDLTFTAQTSSDLTNWKAPGEIVGFTDTVISTTGTIETREAKIPRSSGNCFLRMCITQP